jgi:hypothetical protein
MARATEYHTVGQPDNKLTLKHGSLAISKFEIVGSYFVNLIYNEFHQKSIDLNVQATATKWTSATEIYKSLLSSYSDFTKKPEFFKQTLRGIHTYTISTTNQTTMTHKECVDWVVSELVPAKLLKSFRENQKNKAFHDFIALCVRKFLATIVQQYLSTVFDFRDQQNNVVLLQNEFLEIICLEKERAFAKFINPNDTDLVPSSIYKQRLSELEAAKVTIKAQEKEMLVLSSQLEKVKQFAENTAKALKELKEANQRRDHTQQRALSPPSYTSKGGHQSTKPCVSEAVHNEQPLDLLTHSTVKATQHMQDTRVTSGTDDDLLLDLLD